MRMIRTALIAFLTATMPALVPMTLAAATVPIPATAPVSSGVELVMVDRAGCIYCAAWKDEVMPGYGATPEGRAAPLRIVPLDGPWPDGVVLASRPVITPTFIVLRAGREIARLEGYPGPHFFWPVLAQMLDQAGVTVERPEG